jgi:hypothetical protein
MSKAALAAIASLCLLVWSVPAEAAPDARFPHLERQARTERIVKAKRLHHRRAHRRLARVNAGHRRYVRHYRARPGNRHHIRRHHYRRGPVTRGSVVIGGRPSGCPPRAWCGCWLARHLGMPLRHLWLARNWASVGRPAGDPRVGAVVVWRHHVGRINDISGSRIRVLSGNDGRAVRNRWRSTSGVIAYRVL